MSSLKRKAGPTAAANDPKKPKKDASLTSFFGQPKIVHSTTGSNSSAHAEAQGAAPNFDKAKWAETLSAEQKDLLKLEIDTLDPTWLAHLKDEITTPGFLKLKKFLKSEIDSGKTVFPPLEEVYSWSRHTPLNTVKVVILGQDPYHNHNQAHGLCFSVRPPTPAPPSLKNMFKELKDEYPSFTPPPKNGGLLTPWAEQGVLMLNTCLTVRAHDANSHSNQGWEPFTQKVIDLVAKLRTRGVVFMAWGSPAQKRCTKITGGKHLVLKAVHPSPLSAARGWFGCGHFKQANDWLETRYGKDGIINWDLNVQKPIKAPEVTGEPVKVAESQQKSNTVKESGPATELPEVKAGKPASQKEDFDDEEDEDAIEALNELANSDAAEPSREDVPGKSNETANEPDSGKVKDDVDIAEQDQEDKENRQVSAQ
ncbi:uracil DNA glycosylase [Lithohypha guttulata]|uniref:uracil DNA glycosylase n=1 Tax=Lithohypha guttulata TaxID=1690604 RepID=UPI002DDDD1A4|nr:uracil DNA glycosylase [Lithohypha guttulata]KAK5098224.1 uracil DNA glycosylase [Lithohypha guttulata]